MKSCVQADLFQHIPHTYTSLRTPLAYVWQRALTRAQEDHDEIVVSMVTRSGYNQTHTDFIEEHIKMRGKAKIRVELVDSLPKERSGKTKHIITKLHG